MSAEYPPNNTPPIDFSAEFHTFAVEWDSYQISWFVDDVFYEQRYQNDTGHALIPQTIGPSKRRPP